MGHPERRARHHRAIHFADQRSSHGIGDGYLVTWHAAVQARLAKSNNRTRSSAFQPSLRRAAAAVSCGDSVRSFGVQLTSLDSVRAAT
jgi:hypothetical protein